MSDKTSDEEKQNSRQLNPRLQDIRFRRRRPQSLEYYVEGVWSGDRVILGQAITLIESALPAHRELAREIVDRCISERTSSVRIGVTGAPGVGKSTFIEAMGLHLLAKGRRLAVLAVDPSSRLSRGSILGDKTRMQKLSAEKDAFIRPSPAKEALGGVTSNTREALLLCEAAGFDTILIETVGVGQSEVAVHSMTDFFLLLLQPGAGDELQGIKRGVVEMADLIAVNKADGERETLAKQAERAYRNALHLLPPKVNQWRAKVVRCSALQQTGIAEIWQIIENFLAFTQKNNFFEGRRREQSRSWLQERVGEFLRERFYQHEAVKQERKKIEEAVINGRLSPAKAADILIKLFFKE